jgi:hypothetical protein
VLPRLQLQPRIFPHQISSTGAVARSPHGLPPFKGPVIGGSLMLLVPAWCCWWLVGHRRHRGITRVPVSHREHQANGAGFSLSACAIREITRTISLVPLSGVTSMYRTPAFRSASFLTASRAAAVPW